MSAPPRLLIEWQLQLPRPITHILRAATFSAELVSARLLLLLLPSCFPLAGSTSGAVLFVVAAAQKPLLKREFFSSSR